MISQKVITHFIDELIKYDQMTSSQLALSTLEHMGPKHQMNAKRLAHLLKPMPIFALEKRVFKLVVLSKRDLVLCVKHHIITLEDARKIYSHQHKEG